MSITLEEVKKLASLARLKVSEEEAEKLQTELGAILNYVGQINTLLTDTNISPEFAVSNVFREDENAASSDDVRNLLIENAPDSQDGYIKVKKIM